MRKALKIEPNNAYYHAQLAGLLGETASRDEAEAEQRKAKGVDSRVHENYFRHAFALRKRGDEAGAVSALRDAIKLEPERALYHSYLAQFLVETESHEEAETEWRTAIRLDPQLDGAHLGLALALRKRGDQGGAIKSIREALRIKPRKALYHSYLGQMLAESGLYPEAEMEYAEAIKRSPNNPRTYFGLAIVRAALGDRRGAFEALERALALDPSFERAREQLAQLRSEEERLLQPKDITASSDPNLRGSENAE